MSCHQPLSKVGLAPFPHLFEAVSSGMSEVVRLSTNFEMYFQRGRREDAKETSNSPEGKKGFKKGPGQK